jgi:signal transduction histidine kinase
LVNLISNAVKYTRQGSIQVQFVHSPGQLEVVVKDSGMGIPEKEQKNLFQVFGLIDGGNQHTRSGIGLTLCKQVLDHWGGSILINSKERLGTEARIQVPVSWCSDPYDMVGTEGDETLPQID